ncbi:D-alanyl-D-alanine carboxypeptidase/D-alanyl-D-alanine endopeptidase [Tranquillimonas rosea]|uniref:D-alanyl-D-alanine carboxypeptidase/D-alanyl-D-alanine endopeptidase n=1 Tax=Tranquillimonas rosea TaxID=641238 RepID=UPI003BA8515F
MASSNDPMRLTRRALLGGLMAGVAGRALADAPERSRRPLPRPDGLYKQAQAAADELVRRAGLTGEVGFAVADVSTGLMLETRSPLKGHPPASTAKALTTLYARKTLGGDYRFGTELRTTGPLIDGKIDGDLILAGGGDPTLDTDALGALAERLKEAGVREISGTFRVYTGELPTVREIDIEQPDHVGYNPAVGGLNLNFNRVHFQWEKGSDGYNVSMDARAARYRPDVTMARMSVVERKSPVYTYEDSGGIDDWTVARWALGGSGARWLPVRRPGEYAGEAFRVIARSHGIQLGREIGRSDRPGDFLLARHESAPLDDILRDMMKYSTNLTAEVVGLAASTEIGGPVEDLHASAARMNAWLAEEYSARATDLEDHSGLGDDSRVSPRDMVQALVQEGADSKLRDLMKEVSVPGRPDLKVKAKTGTLNFCSCLVGYLQAPGNTTLAFAIFTADVERRDALPMEQRERPPGGRAWLARSRNLQKELLERWGVVFGT